MTETINLKELLVSKLNNGNRIISGSELLLAYELDKYTKKLLGKPLSLEGITIDSELLGSDHFSFVVTNGLDIGYTPTREELADYSRNERNYFYDTVENIAFVKDTDEEVVYTFDHNVSKNLILHQRNRSAGYISLVAYLIVRAYGEGKQPPKLVIAHENYNQGELEYSDLFILKLHGNMFLEELVEVNYTSAWGHQPEWEAFLIFNRQRGIMNREYSTTEKYEHLVSNYKVGDVVLLYSRKKGAKGMTINKLTACYPAVIRSISQQSVQLFYYPTIQTRLTRYQELEKVERENEENYRDSIYQDEDFERFIEGKETFDLTSIGISDCSFIEENFFIKPVDFDGTHQYLQTVDGVKEFWMSTLDTIYAVFEDRGVEYNKEAFLNEHFTPFNRIPLYDKHTILHAQ